MTSFSKKPPRPFIENPAIFQKPRPFIENPSFFKNPWSFSKMTSFSKIRPFIKTRVFKNPDLLEIPLYSLILKII